MKKTISEISPKLPAEDSRDYRRVNQRMFELLNCTCIVIDDDPTGNQTVYDIPLLSDWSVQQIASEFRAKTPMFFILANSRSLTAEKAYQLYQEIGENIRHAARDTGRSYMLVSRSDSTLRGHFQAETQALIDSTAAKSPLIFFTPVMFEGGRVTLNDTHYILERESLIPVSDTPFAKDHSFGYENANLPAWIEEKTGGHILAHQVRGLSLEKIRTGTPESLAAKINLTPNLNVCFCNALNYQDLDKVCFVLLWAMLNGKEILFRTSSSFLPSIIGQPPREILSKEELINPNHKNGGLIVVGSYVPKSSQQLEFLLQHIHSDQVFELDVQQVIDSPTDAFLKEFSRQLDQALAQQQTVVLYTSRKLITGNSSKESLDIGSKISEALVSIVSGLSYTPSYILSKGGITSNNLATKALKMKRGVVLGQILPGVPVWRVQSDSPLATAPFIVFPGNVGKVDSLVEVIQKLS